MASGSKEELLEILRGLQGTRKREWHLISRPKSAVLADLRQEYGKDFSRAMKELSDDGTVVTVERGRNATFKVKLQLQEEDAVEQAVETVTPSPSRLLAHILEERCADLGHLVGAVVDSGITLEELQATRRVLIALAGHYPDTEGLLAAIGYGLHTYADTIQRS
jgi:hypothetical protein